MSGLFKTTIVVWSDFDPRDEIVSDAGKRQRSVHKHRFCQDERTAFVADPKNDPDFPYDASAFFAWDKD
jgi:hypothetical protein